MKKKSIKFEEYLHALPKAQQEEVERLGKELVRETRLRSIREELNITQTELAERLGVKQPAVVSIERQRDLRISTVQRYLAALGLKATLNIQMPNGESRIVPV